MPKSPAMRPSCGGVLVTMTSIYSSVTTLAWEVREVNLISAPQCPQNYKVNTINISPEIFLERITNKQPHKAIYKHGQLTYPC